MVYQHRCVRGTGEDRDLRVSRRKALPGSAVKSLTLAIAAMSMLPFAARAADKLPPQVNGNLGSAVQCETLSGLTLPNATVTVAQTNTDGQFAVPNSTTIIRNLPAFCRVHVVVKPAINVEVWMPISHWNGKLLAVEPGGTLGSIVGSAVTASLAPRIGAVNLLLVSVALLELAVFTVVRFPLQPQRAAGETIPATRISYSRLRMKLGRPITIGAAPLEF